ncbi:Flp family type IVb pilin [Arthrobacter sp. NPDC058097]|uniref:Flp family type IVb pilin n=1 Tax=Arthrobacter sp. NPDC058097 TaxID=3346340 RepID=UPI0036D86F0B
MFAFFSNTAANIRRGEKGATAVEYGIMVALIAVVVIAAVTLLGGGMKDAFTQVQCSINGKTFTAVAAGAAAGTATCA